MARWCVMIRDLAFSGTHLSDGIVTIRPCGETDAAILALWFSNDAVDRWKIRIVGEFTIWPFIVAFENREAAFLQVWRTSAGTGGLEIFVAPECRRHGVALRALPLIAGYLRSELHWPHVTIEPHSDDAAAIACFKKAGFVDNGKRRDDGDHTHVILEWP